ncbi:MAG TPA: DsrE family protein [Candidatus Kryptonia bacterium]
MAIQKDHSTVQVNVFLMADAVSCGISNQNTAQGYYNIERMIKAVVQKGGKIKACGTCADARGVKSLPLIEGIEASNMAELAMWTVEADTILTF